ncbi:hypothetical protein BBJ28_00022025 [Nothophytophthora sp. Chile5]|nr:hypothetical protein BBJ28_00022025 [Nothophytophthora sp. Chile5]
MERFVTSAPQRQPSYPPSVSPMSVSSPASISPPAAALPPIPFSAIQSGSDGSDDGVGEARPTVSISSSEASDAPCDLSESQLIARGRVLLHAYQTQKKQWLKQQESGQDGHEEEVSSAFSNGNSPLNIFRAPSERYESTDTQRESVKKTVKQLAANGAPCIDTKLDDLPPPPPPISVDSSFSTFSIGPLPLTSDLKLHEPAPTSTKTSEKSWNEFIQLLRTNGRTMDAVDAQLAEIWGALVETDEQARGPQSSVSLLSRGVTELLQQKREAEVAIAKFTEVLGSRVFLTGKMADDAVQFVSNHLKLELEASQVLVERVKAERSAHKSAEAKARRGVNGSNGVRALEGEKLLRQQLLEKDEQLQASEAAVEKLKEQLVQQEQAAIDRQELLERALDVKWREIDALCYDIALPEAYKRVTNEHGVVCFKKTDGDDELEDPRVQVAIEQRIATTASTAAAVSAGGVASADSSGATSNGKLQPPRLASSRARDFAAADNVMRRSFSTPHISRDCDVFEDIHVPPDDGCKHTIDDFATPLPAGWEMRVTASGAVFFFNKYTTTTTWTDPRLLGTSTSAASPRYFHQKPQLRDSIATTVESRPSRSSSIAANTDHPHSPAAENQAGVQFFDVAFKEHGPIGIHFQANVPDSGATVRRLLPRMAAANAGVLEPYDELVAVNKTAVGSAPFRHVMLLLQGGLRPLTLTFRRDLKRVHHSMPSTAASDARGGEAHSMNESDSLGLDLDEEVLLDEGVEGGSQELRVPATAPVLSHSQLQSQGHTQLTEVEVEEEDLTVADVIITNIFSLFWRPPEATGEVQTV